MRLCCLLAGQPLCHHERPEAAFFVARAATRRRTAYGQPTTRVQRRRALKVERRQSTGQGRLGRAGCPRTRNRGRAGYSCVFESSWKRPGRVFAFFVTLCIFTHTSSQGRHRHRSVCADSEAVVAATRRICAALRRGARISSAYSVHAVAQVKAIIAAPPLSGGQATARAGETQESRCQWCDTETRHGGSSGTERSTIGRNPRRFNRAGHDAHQAGGRRFKTSPKKTRERRAADDAGQSQRESRG